MLIRLQHLRGIRAGTVQLAFRKWQQPVVKAGTHMRTAVGIIAIDAIDAVSENRITEAEAAAAGYVSRAALLDELQYRNGHSVYRIRLRYAGEDPRMQLSQDTMDICGIPLLLQQFDHRSRHGAWTFPVLRLIGTRPNIQAGTMAEQLQFDKEWLKRKIRQLKELGLTQSLPDGYALTPRGEKVLQQLKQQ